MRRLFAIAAVLAFAATTCKLRLPPAGKSNTEGDFPCETSESCPAADHACLLATCMDGQCVFVPAPNGVLPEEDQVIGDCKQLFCDGEGEVIAYASQFDLPQDEGNPCTEAVCDLDVAKQEPKIAGTHCGLANGDEGLCNGASKCGVCLPDVHRCAKQAVATCNADGQWGMPIACATDKPVCAEGSCIGVVELDTGAEHACARFDDGSVRCWGNAGRGQLGESGLAGSRTPPWAGGFSSMRIGNGHQCGVRQDGTVWCWGSGELGQLGNGARLSSPGPLATGVSAIALDVGDHHSCAIAKAGMVRCWGRNDLGQLGSGKPPSAPLSAPLMARPRKPHLVPVLISGLSDANSLDLDGSHTCIVRKNGERRCWGLPFDAIPSHLPAPTDNPDAPEIPPEVLQATIAKPTLVAGIADAVELGCGSHHCCARRRTGGVSCWGSGAKGALGTGTPANSFKAVAVKGVTGAQRIGVGSHFACVLESDASVKCWGANDRGQLGTGVTAPFDTAKVIATLGKVQTVAVGDDHVCALLETGELSCWGDNRAGQLAKSGAVMAREPGPVAWP